MSHRTNRRHKRNIARERAGISKLPICWMCHRVIISDMQRCNYGLTKYCHRHQEAKKQP